VSVSVPDMAERLALDPVADGFVSRHPADPVHVFGGLLVAQALRAATHTVGDDRGAASLHAAFVLGGTGGAPIRYAVERTRDGGSFSSRRVVASQDRGPVLVLTADFHVEEEGAAYEPDPPAGVPGPDGLPPGRYDNPHIECRDVPPDGSLVRRAWFRATEPLPDDPALHLQTVAYLSDFGATRAAREPHAHLDDDANRQSVSLDHSVWFHAPARADGWLLSSMRPAATGRGRGLAMGSIHQDGRLVATVAQGVLLRTRQRA
jgi:acyl-CoA thioesterase-2